VAIAWNKFLGTVAAFGVLAVPCAGRAQQSAAGDALGITNASAQAGAPATSPAQSTRAPVVPTGAAAAPVPPARAAAPAAAELPIADKPQADTAALIDARKSYAIPAAEIVGFDFLLNRFNRRSSGDYNSTLSTIRHNLRSAWVVDNDPFQINQLGHPYQGSMYHGFARSAGLTYWESLGYTFAGSVAWEIAGEKTPPSKNDQINTGIGGSFLGEALFRMSNLVLEHGNVPKFWRELAAAAISPSTGFNRLAYGERFAPLYPSHDPAYYSRLQLGFSGTSQNNAGTSTTTLKRNEALADFSLEYGLPGKPDYSYTRPFDYFAFQATASSANGFESVATRGLLAGREYEVGANYRGVLGLYGSYDYFAPQIFRVSSTALSLGTTGQAWLTQSIALQGTALLGAGYTAVGTTHGAPGERDYNYGTSPQALLALRLIFGNQAALDLTARDYFVPRAADQRGRTNVARLEAGITWRVSGRHGVTVRYLGTRRDASFPDLGDRKQIRGTIGVFYTFLGHERFGAVEWR